MTPPGRFAVFSVLLLTSMPLRARGDETHSFPLAMSTWGSRGGEHVEAALPLPAHSLILSLGGDYSSASNFVVHGATNQNAGAHITLLWAAIRGIEIFARGTTSYNRNPQLTPNTMQTLGDPELGFKGSVQLGKLGVGGGVRARIPTSAMGTGLDPSALVLTMYGAASFAPIHGLLLSLNGGYVVDRSRNLFRVRHTAVQRFAAGISSVDRAVAGLSVEGQWAVSHSVFLDPFAELTAGFGIDAALKRDPIVATVGLNAAPAGAHGVQFSVGCDVALQGEAAAHSKMTGVAPWQLFLRASVPLIPGARGSAQFAGPVSCQSDAACGTGLSCVDQRCVVVKKVVEKEVTATPTFAVTGAVHDPSGKAIGSASISVSGVTGSPLAVDYKTGSFKTWPIPVGNGLIKVTAQAPGYRTAEQTIARGKAGEVKQIAFKLQSSNAVMTGVLKGSLKDVATGHPVRHGQVVIPVLQRTIRTNRNGKFSASLKAGRYDVLVSGRHYVTQRKEIEVRAGDTVILNADMVRKSR